MPLSVRLTSPCLTCQPTGIEPRGAQHVVAGHAAVVAGQLRPALPVEGIPHSLQLGIVALPVVQDRKVEPVFFLVERDRQPARVGVQHVVRRLTDQMEYELFSIHTVTCCLLVRGLRREDRAGRPRSCTTR